MFVCLSASGCSKKRYKVWRAEGGTTSEEVRQIMEVDYVIFTQEFFDKEFVD